VPRPGRRVVRKLVLVSLAVAAAAAATLGALWVATPDVDSLRAGSPRTTALVEQRRVEARAAGRPFDARLRPVPLERISPRLVEAVILSEDAGFFGHGPFDLGELRQALGQSLEAGRLVRGASTLTQQLAKNLFLGTERSLWRKAREAVLAVKLERALGKRRILALYLNVAEWGDGVFGAEAAARDRFGVAASGLDIAQATVLAAMLPAPRKADLAAPSPWLARRSRRVLDLLLEQGRVTPEEHAHASAELERILAGPSAGGEDAEPPEE
jgi:monofunctional biosynthetic peptidoglycan transglycosylase